MNILSRVATCDIIYLLPPQLTLYGNIITIGCLHVHQERRKVHAAVAEETVLLILED